MESVKSQSLLFFLSQVRSGEGVLLTVVGGIE